MILFTTAVLIGAAWAEYPQVDTSLGKDDSALQGPPLGYGLGVTLGVPTGLSATWRPSDIFALQAGLAWHGQEERISSSADLLINISELESDDIEDGLFMVYAGIGTVVRWGQIGNIKISDWNVGKAMMGIRIPTGVVYLPEERRVDVFLEVVPTFYVIPTSEVDLSAAIGARIYFGGEDSHL